MNETWLNLNSFAAGLLRTGAVSWVNFAIWQLRTALELKGPFVENRLLVATEWVLLAGDKIRHFLRAPVVPPGIQYDHRNSLDITSSLATGDLAAAAILPALSVSRWRFWMGRFDGAGASEAFGAMNEVEMGNFKVSVYV